MDVSVEDGEVGVITEPAALESVREALSRAGVQATQAEVAQLPKNIVPLDRSAAVQTLRLLEQLDELDDVARVYSNADFPVEALEAVSAS